MINMQVEQNMCKCALLATYAVPCVPEVYASGPDNACIQLQFTESQSPSSPDGLRQPGVDRAHECTAAQPHHQAHEHHARHACMCTRQHHAC